MQINSRMLHSWISSLALAGWLPGEEVGLLGQPSRKMSHALTDGPVPSGPNGFRPLVGTTGGKPNFSHLLAKGDA